MLKFFCLFLIMCHPLTANSITNLLYLEGAYRVDTIEWKLNQRQKALETFTEAKWKNVQAFEISTGGAISPFSHFKICKRPLDFIHLTIDGGLIVASPHSNFHGDYKESNTSPKLYTKRNHKSSMHGGNFSFAFSLSDRICKSVYLTVSLGYAMQQRSLKTPDLRLFPSEYELEESKNLVRNFYYKLFWQGPSIKTGIIYTPTQSIDMLAELEYQRPFFRGTSCWVVQETLSDDFILNSSSNMSQKGVMNGFKGKLRACYCLGCGWKATLTGCGEFFVKNSGTDKNEAQETWRTPSGMIIGQGRIKTKGVYSVTFSSWSLSAGIGYVY